MLVNKTVRATAFCSHSQKNSSPDDTKQTPSFANAEIGQFNFVAEIAVLLHIYEMLSPTFSTLQ